MVVGVWKVELHIPYAQNLKDKRNILQSVVTKTRNRFNVSVAELDYKDKWQRCVMGIACVDSEYRKAENVFSSIRKIFEETGSVIVVKENISYYPLED
ncbi:MAG: DUF503 domain-containing protein [Candidatus Omnitrophica bacterium]|jgi:uncharacterized protein YlxP (DUF503 family)|nr:DUF503 domain-containing protein [Candidatus Omnitrophota bacterium]